MNSGEKMRKTSVFVATIASLFALFFNDAAYAVDAVPATDPAPISQSADAPTAAPVPAATEDPVATADPAPTVTPSATPTLTDSSTPTATPAPDATNPFLQQTLLSNVPTPVIVQVPRADLSTLVAWSTNNGADPDYVYHRALSGIAAELTEVQIAELKQLIPTVKVTTDTIVTTDTTQTNAIWNLSTLDQTGASPDTSYTYPASAGAGVKVYVVDTGVSANPQLGTRLLPGRDFTGSGTTSDCNGHGTHVAGTIASTTYGVAKKAYIVPVHVLGPTTTCNGSGSLSDVVSGIEWAIADNPAGTRAVLNMSLGSAGSNSALSTAVNNAIADGIVVVVAAGNDGLPACYYTPASIPGAITVGAIDRTNADASFSNYGTCVDIYAPGVSITSLDALNPGSTLTWNGTSMASPHVAGAAALWLADHPNDTVAAVTDALVNVNSEQGGITFRARSVVSASPNRMLDIRGFTPSALVNTQPPATTVASGTPSGAPRYGGTMSATRGVWSTGATMSYQWYSCLVASNSAESIIPDGCTQIGLATNPDALSLDSLDYVGKHMLIAETATTRDSNGDITQQSVMYSSTKGPVAQSPVNTLAPSITGSSGVGAVVTASDGEWDGSPTPTLSRQWYSCAAEVTADTGTLPTGCTAIPGATATTFTITTSQLDRYITVEAKAMNSAVASAVSRFSVSTAVVTQAPVNVTAPVTSVSSAPGANGTPRYVEAGTSSVLSVSDGAWTGTLPRPLTFQWFRCTQSHTVITDFVTLTDDCELIPGQSDNHVTVTADEVEKYVGAVVTSTNSIGASSVAAATTTIVNAAPVATVEPRIEGDPIAGSTLSINRGTWVGSPYPTFTYVWHSCTFEHTSPMSSKPSDCTAIANATATSLTLDTSHKSKYMLVMVKAMNNAVVSPTIRYTATTASVLVAPTLSSAPTIKLTSGSTADANSAPTYRPTGLPASTSLTVAPGVWSGSATITYSYDWYRCDAAQEAGAARGDSCLIIDNSLSSDPKVHVVTPDDVGHVLVVSETATNAAREVRTYTKSTLFVSQSARATTPPSISGAVTEGNPLDLTGAVWEGYPEPLFTYQWFACTNAVGSSSASAPAADAGCAAVTGATSARFIPRRAQSGKYIMARVSATNSASASATLVHTATTLTTVSQSPTITTARPGADSAPIYVASTPASTSQLSAFNSNNQAATAQWYRCDAEHEPSASLSEGCQAISGATGQTYDVTSSDVGFWILADVDSSGTVGVAFTATTPGAVGAPPVNTVAPTIEGGSSVVGQSLQANAGTWTGTPTPSLTYQWFKCTSATTVASTVPASCKAISGATGTGLTILDAYKDLYLAVRVVATNSAVGSAGAVTRVSASTSKVLVEPSNTVAVRVSSSVTADTGAPVSGSVLTAVAGTWKGTGPFTITYQWYVCDSVVDSSAGTLPADCTLISGATSKTFNASDSYVGKYLTVIESVGNAAATEQKWATASLTVASKPVRVTEPGVVGTAARGQTLTASTGTVNGTPDPTYAYTWLRCSSNQVVASAVKPAACTAITGATAATYVAAPADVAKFIAVTVVAKNSAGSVSRTSSSTAAVLDPVSLTAIGAPTVGNAASDGSPRVDGTVSTTGGTWAGTPTSKTYQWYRCDVALASSSSIEPDGCALIPDATSASYTLVGDDAAKFLAVRVVATNAVSSATVWSPSTVKDTVLIPVSTAAVTLDATDVMGETITATAGTWSATPTQELTYVWYRCSSAVLASTSTLPAGCAEIPNAETGLTHRLIAGDANKFVLLAEKASNRGGATRVFSASSEQIVSPPSIDGTIGIEGNAWVGRSVSVTNDNFTGAPTPTKTYQWFTCDSLYAPGLPDRPDDCVAISAADATERTLAVVQGYDTKYLMVEVTASNHAGDLLARSGAVDLVKRIPVNVDAPSITGSAVPDQVLTAESGTWDGTETIAYEYQWYRCASRQNVASNTAPTGCSSIVGAFSSTYTVTAADIEKYLLVRATAKNGTEDVAKFSASTAIVSTMPKYSTGLAVSVFSPASTGAPRAGGEVRSVPGTWTSRPTPSFGYQWYTCAAYRAAVTATLPGTCDIVDGATSANLPVTRAMVGLYPVVKVTATTLAGSESRYSASPVKAVLTPPFATTAPAVSGYPYVKATLTTTAGVWDASPTSTQKYSWYQCTSEVTTSVTTQPVGCTPIANQIKSTLPLVDAYRGKFISSMITATNAAGTVKQWSVSTQAITTGPVNTVAPTLSTNPVSVARVDGTVTVARGTWVGDPAPVADDDEYAWYICDNAVTAASLTIDDQNCSLIYGENYATLTVPDQVNMFLVAAVTAHNIHGSYTIYSKSTGAIASTPVNLTPPALSDADKVGLQITATAGSWEGTPEPRLTYRWLSCETLRGSATVPAPSTSDCVVRPGTTDSYTPSDEDTGRYIVVEETATNAAAAVAAWSASSQVIVSGPVNKTPPTITITNPASNGAPFVSGSVSTTGGTWLGHPTPEKSYQWVRCVDRVTTASASMPNNCANIDGAEMSSYDPVADDAGMYLVVRVTGTNPYDEATVYSASTALQVRMAPVMGNPPQVRGVLYVQGTARVKEDTWRAFPEVSKTYQWYVCNASVDNDSETLPSGCSTVIDGANVTYSIPVSQRGKFLLVRITAQNGEGASVTHYSASSVAITDGPVNTVSPVITGQARVGANPLSVGEGQWVPVTNAPTITYQWYRCNIVVSAAADDLDPAAGCQALDGDTSSAHSIVGDDAGKSLLVGVTGTNSIGATTRYTASTALTTEQLTLISNPYLIGAAQSTTRVHANEGSWRGFPAPTTVHTWYRCKTAVAAGTTLPLAAGCTKIALADPNPTDPQYVLNSSTDPKYGDIGKYILFEVKKTIVGDPSITIHGASIGPVTEIPNFQNTPPEIKFDAPVRTSDSHPRVGDRLKVVDNLKMTTTGGAAVTRSVAWYRCASLVDIAGSAPAIDVVIPDGCTEISGATGTSYTVTGDDLESYITAKVTGTNSAGSNSWLSPNSSLQVQSVPAVTVAPTISGDRLSGATLTLTDGEWSAFPTGTITRQWYRCTKPIATGLTNPVWPLATPAGQSCTEINIVPDTDETDGVGATTYVQTDSDREHFVTAKISYRNSADETVYLIAAPSDLATAFVPVLVTSPQLSQRDGIYKVGQTFQVGGDKWTATPAPTVTYQWYTCESAVAVAAPTLASGCTSIGGATNSEYYVVEGDVGNFLMASARAENAAGSAIQYSKTSAQIGAGYAYTVAPTVSLSDELIPTSGTITASAVPASWSGTPTSVIRNWFACARPISAVTSELPDGADGCQPTSEDPQGLELSIDKDFEFAGMYLAYGEQATWADGVTRVILSTTTARTTQAPMLWTTLGANYVQPSVTLTAIVGVAGKLTIGAWNKTYPLPTTGTTWRGSPTGTVTQQWLRCDSPRLAMSDVEPTDCSDITGATTVNYTPQHVDAHKYLAVRLTAQNAVGSTTVWTASGLEVTERPTNRDAEPPTVTWTTGADNPKLGDTLTLHDGGWDGFPDVITYTYRWFSCAAIQNSATNAAPSGCSVITGVTGATFTPAPGTTYAGKYILGEVTATNDAGSAKKYSATTPQMFEAPANTTAPTVAGTPDVGKTLTATSAVTNWRATPALVAANLTYQWFACANALTSASSQETVATGCDAITGQTASVISLPSSTRQKYVVVRVKATNAAGSAYRSSTSSTLVKEKARNTEAPAFRTDADIVGQQLTVTDGTWDGYPNPTLSRQWYVCTAAANPADAVDTTKCTAQTGKTGTTFEIDNGAKMAGNYILAAVTATTVLNGGSVTTVKTTQTRGPIRQSPYNTGNPTISGTAHLGETLTAALGTWAGVPAPTKTYRWFWCSPDVAPTAATDALPGGCQAITGSDNAPLVINSDLVSLKIVLEVTGSNSVSDKARYSAASKTVSSSPTLSTAPVITGASKYANGTNSATVSTGTWNGTPTPNSFAYLWYRCDTESAASSTLPAGCTSVNLTTATIKLPTAASGQYLVARVTATAAVNKVSAASAVTYSASFGRIETAPVNASAPTITGIARDGQALSASVGTWTGYSTPTTQYKWYRCGTTAFAASNSVPAGCVWIGGGNNQDLNLSTGEVGHRMMLVVVATNSTGAQVTKTSATTAVVAAAAAVTSASVSFGYTPLWWGWLR